MKPIKDKIKPASHLINIIRSSKQHHPNVALFLGAGASRTSGVKLASEMINEWRKMHFAQYPKGRTLDEHMNAQYWYCKSEEYSKLFEELFDTPAQRREYIENCLEKASPSWGYIYLVNLIRNNIFNTVLTTNFDDLLNEACYLYSSDTRPMVCAHDSSISTVRITSKRPKIVKLHGDFLFDNIKNTITETERLDDNMREKLKQYAAEYGLIVVGYSGHDRSIMDSLHALLSNPKNFPTGVYWCIRDTESEVSERLDVLSRFPRFYYVQIDGFDELFAEINSQLELELQDEMSNPYQALVGRLNTLVSSANIPTMSSNHPIIIRDIKRLGEKVAAITDSKAGINPITANDIKINLGTSNVVIPIPFLFLAQIQEMKGNMKSAIDLALKEINNRPSEASLKYAYELMIRSKQYEFKDELLKLMTVFGNSFANKGAATDIALLLMSAEQYEEADKLLDLGYKINSAGGAQDWIDPFFQLNKLQIKAHQNISFDEREIEQLKSIARLSVKGAQFGAQVLLKEWEGAQENLLELIKSRVFNAEAVRTWPITKLLREHITNEELKDALNESKPKAK